MKTPIFIIVVLSFLFIGCSTSRLTQEEYLKFSYSGDTILYEYKPVAIYKNIEWNYYRGKMKIEVSVEQIGGPHKFTGKLLDYIITKHPKSRVEIKLPLDSFRRN